MVWDGLGRSGTVLRWSCDGSGSGLGQVWQWSGTGLGYGLGLVWAWPGTAWDYPYYFGCSSPSAVVWNRLGSLKLFSGVSGSL